MPVELGAITLGSTVRTTDGEELGKLEKLIVDPSTQMVKAAVVRKGFILTDDVEVPLEALEESTQGEVRLNLTADQARDLPRFYEANYTAPPASYVPPVGTAYPPGGLLWPAMIPPYPAPLPAAWTQTPAVPGEVVEMQRQQDLSNAVIDEGSDVIARDGEKVGEVHSAAFETESGRPLKLIVRKGFLFTQDFELPGSLISGVDDGVVYLNATRDELSARSKPAV